MRGLFDGITAEFATITEICNILGCKVNTPHWCDNFGSALHNYIKQNNTKRVKTLSLFSGAGGLDIGFHDLGFEIIESVEIERKFCDTLELNSGTGRKFRSAKVNCIDIREYQGGEINSIDFIIGGPPCQTFSAAGRRASGVLGTSDARGVLFKEYIRLLKHFKPIGFLFENVYGIVGAQNGSAWREIIEGFAEVGYTLSYRILDAADYGVPQHRERLIIIGLRSGNFKFPRPTHGPDSIDNIPFYNAGCAIDGVKLSDKESKVGIGGRYGALIDNIPPGLNYSFYTKEMGYPSPIFSWRSKFSDFMYKADPERPVRTIKAQGGQYTGPLHWDNRYFSVSEYKRLQTFPDNYEISGSRQVAIHQIGNSVPPQLGRMLAMSIATQIFNINLPFKIELLNSNAELSFRKRKRLLTNEYREKAKNAISKLNIQKSQLPQSKEYYASLENNFKFTTCSNIGDYRVHVDWGDSLVVNVLPRDSNSRDNVSIEIDALDSWSLPTNTIKINIAADSWLDVTVAWKIVSKELSDNNFMADLIQLNGYYQYQSQLTCRLKRCKLTDHHILKSIIEGLVVGRNISTKELSQRWNISEDMVLHKAILLRDIGYEIRNNITNPQIPKETWLIPYKFPTLTNDSVQLKKSLI